MDPVPNLGCKWILIPISVVAWIRILISAANGSGSHLDCCLDPEPYIGCSLDPDPNHGWKWIRISISAVAWIRIQNSAVAWVRILNSAANGSGSQSRL
mgnify:CR=1 FL=1